MYPQWNSSTHFKFGMQRHIHSRSAGAIVAHNRQPCRVNNLNDKSCRTSRNDNNSVTLKYLSYATFQHTNGPSIWSLFMMWVWRWKGKVKYIWTLLQRKAITLETMQVPLPKAMLVNKKCIRIHWSLTLTAVSSLTGDSIVEMSWNKRRVGPSFWEVDCNESRLSQYSRVPLRLSTCTHKSRSYFLVKKKHASRNRTHNKVLRKRLAAVDP